MGYFQTFKGQAKSEIGLKLKYKKSFIEIKEASENSAKPVGKSAVAKGVSEKEFIDRYNGLRVTLYVIATLFIFVFYKMLSFEDAYYLIFSVLFLSIVSVFYYKYSFVAWRARKIYRDWENRDKNAIFYYAEYNNDMMLSKKEFFPISLPDKGSKVIKK